MVADSRTGLITDMEAYYTFMPRKDNLERWDEQTAFYNSKNTGVSFLLGGNGCTPVHYQIYDPVNKESRPIGSIRGRHWVLAVNPQTGHLEPALAEAPYRKGEAPILSITLSTGERLHCTQQHRLLLSQGTWVQAGQLRVGDAILSVNPSCREPQAESQVPHTCSSRFSRIDTEDLRCAYSEARLHSTIVSSDQAARTGLWSRSCEPHYSQTDQGSQAGYRSRHHSCDERLLSRSGIALDVLPSQDDVLAHSLLRLLLDDPGDAQECIRGNVPSFRASQLVAAVHNEWSTLTLSDALRPCVGQLSDQLRSGGDFSPACTALLLDQLRFACSHPKLEITLPRSRECYITRIELERTQDFYDFGVPGYGNYYAGGLIHANSGTTVTSLAKVCKFLLETPAPRRNTPFWIIAESYEQVCSMWDEKLCQQGHLPHHVIDWDRVHWYKRNNNWPFRVPLKSHQGAGGKNWLLEFKSWNQGRGQMQARSVGGFLFIEQFPWPVFQEVVRGCREYNFPGAKLVEYTPVDPDLSIEIEEMLTNGEDPGPGLRQKGAVYLPHNWKVYHANTACAMEAGHVDKEWFKEYFGMIPEDMLDVRMKGLFASFEGTIYKEFDQQIHCVGDEVWPQLTNAHWVRGIDWGGGPENAFVCLFCAFDSQGVAYIMDEYYSLDQTYTTIDHLCAIQEMMPEFGTEDKRYGMTYADPADPDNFRIAAKLSQYAKQHKGISIKNMSMGRAKNAVYEGIEHVRMLLKCSREVTKVDLETGELTHSMAPRLYIHKANCPNLCRELKTYRWLRSGENSRNTLNPRNARRAPSKFNDHAVDAARYLLFTYHGMVGATIDSAKRLNRDVHQDRNDTLFPDTSRLSGISTAHRA